MSNGPFDIFLKLDGIDGESTIKGHENETVILSYEAGIDHPAPPLGGGGGAAAGKSVDPHAGRGSRQHGAFSFHFDRAGHRVAGIQIRELYPVRRQGRSIPEDFDGPVAGGRAHVGRRRGCAASQCGEQTKGATHAEHASTGEGLSPNETRRPPECAVSLHGCALRSGFRTATSPP